jgi:ribosomal protein S18 acetylase RimI-like enzyme
MLPWFLRSAGSDALRALRFVRALEAKHPREPHYYLPFIGVAPQWQGRGFGAALMRPMLERCDAEGAPAYLEASTARNRALYERHGFEVSGDRISVSDSPPMTPMWRGPRG